MHEVGKRSESTRDEPHRELLPYELAIEILEGYHPRHVRLLVHQAGSKEAFHETAVPTVSKEQHQVHQRRSAVRILHKADAPATVLRARWVFFVPFSLTTRTTHTHTAHAHTISQSNTHAHAHAHARETPFSRSHKRVPTKTREKMRGVWTDTRPGARE